MTCLTRARRAPTVRLGLVLVALGAAGCDTVGSPIDALRQKKPAPDEFQVLARNELRMPGSVAPGVLPPPQPGVPSPLDPDPQAQAIAAINDELSAPYAPASTQVSRGEVALASAADAGAADPNIRLQLAEENAELAANAPYEAPTVLELFGGDEGAPDPDTVLDPAEEARRLQQSGLVAPVDPDARIEGDAPPVEPFTNYYDTATQGRAPRNTFDNTGTRSDIDDRPPANTTGTVGGSF